MSKRNELIDRALELLEDEHNCDQNNCLIQKDVAEEYPIHIIDCFAGSGAASDEFCRIAKKVVTHRQSSREANKICKTIPHMECACHATLWDIYGEYDSGEVVQCPSCGICLNWKGEVRK